MDENLEGLSVFDKHVNKSDHGGNQNACNRPILYEKWITKLMDDKEKKKLFLVEATLDHVFAMSAHHTSCPPGLLYSFTLCYCVPLRGSQQSTCLWLTCFRNPVKMRLLQVVKDPTKERY
jgi:hypothetical protein